MAMTFRHLLENLRAAGELGEVKKAVDIHHITTLVDQSEQALLFRAVAGYEMPALRQGRSEADPGEAPRARRARTDNEEGFFARRAVERETGSTRSRDA